MSVTDAPVRLESADGGTAIVLFDRPGASVNAIDRAVIEALGSVLDRLEAAPPPAGVLFLSGKRDFCVGADVTLIAAIASRDEAIEGSRRGQELYARLAALPCPTVAAVAGSCLGGGLEWVLACDRIVVAAGSDTRLGLPEVKLGLIPGWGGTQRLPRRVGIGPAVDLMASGRLLDPERALAIGLADRIAPAGKLRPDGLAELIAMKGRAPSGRSRWRRAGFVGVAARWLPPARAFVFSRIEREVARRAGPHYPAPRAVVEAVRAACSGTAVAGFARERELLGDLAVTPVSRRLVGLLLLTQDAKRWYDADTKAAEGKAVRTVAVLGAGIMGAGIAHLAASRGLEVILKDVSEAVLAAGLARIRGLVEADTSRRRISEEDGKALLARLRTTLEAGPLGTADLIIEAVIEDLDLKRKVLGEAAAAAPAALLATNTSALPIGEMAQGLADPGRLVGLHFFNPVHRMPLVEVVVPRGASAAAAGAAITLARRLGKTPIRVADRPGFLVNRILAGYLAEAVALFTEGCPLAEIDRVLRDFGMPMGPFELLDEIGLDVAARVSARMTAAWGERIARSDLLDRMLAAGRAGRKGGLGFYRHGGRRPVADEDGVRACLGETRRPIPASEELVVPRLLYPMVTEASRCLEEGVVSRAGEIDLALILGIGWPPFRGGLLRWADEVGAPALVTALDRLADAHGARFVPSPEMRRRAAANARFHAA
jgi:3-hydroxyacyl-CoA dehydrogenase / enoyl-CoA hydratase / 3-hydroxybutyryl-CoA epimerase